MLSIWGVCKEGIAILVRSCSICKTGSHPLFHTKNRMVFSYFALTHTLIGIKAGLCGGVRCDGFLYTPGGGWFPQDLEEEEHKC